MFGPYGLIFAGVAIVIALGAAYLQGRSDGRDGCEAQAARDAHVAQVATAAAADAAASAISGIKVTNRTIQNEVQRQILREPVYVDCQHSEQQLRNINAALAGTAEPPGRGLVPATGAADGLQLRRDDGQAR